MTTLLRTVGTTYATTGSNRLAGKRVMLKNPNNGDALAVIVDPNLAAAPSSYGDHSTTAAIFLLKSSDRVTWANAGTSASFSTGQVLNDGTDKYPVCFSAAISPDGTKLYVVYPGDSNNTVRMSTFTWTGTQWGSHAIEEVANATAMTSYKAVSLDIAVSPHGAVGVGIVAVQGATGPRARRFSRIKRLSDGTWQAVTSSLTGATTQVKTPHSIAHDCSIAFFNGGTTTSERMSFAHWSLINTGDTGIVYESVNVNPTTGATISANPVVNLGRAGQLAYSPAYTATYKLRTISLIPVDTHMLCGFGEVANIGVAILDPTAVLVPMSVQTIASMYLPGQFTFTRGPIMTPAFTGGVVATGYMTYTYIGSSGPVHKSFILYDEGAGTRNNGFWGSSSDIDAQDTNVSSPVPMYISTTNCVNGAWETNQDRDATQVSVRVGGVTGWSWYARGIPTPETPSILLPAGVMNTSQLPVSVHADLGYVAGVATPERYPQMAHAIHLQIASNSGFTTDLIDATTGLIAAMRTPSANTPSADRQANFNMPASLLVHQGTRYMRAALVDDAGHIGPYSSVMTFTVSHPPSALGIAPANNSVVPYGTGDVGISWSFHDPWPADVQTAYRVYINRTSDNSNIYDSTPVSSGSTSHIATVSAIYEDESLYYQVQVADADGVWGALSSPVFFTMATSPTVVIDTPTDGATLTSPVLFAQFTPTVPGGRTINQYLVQVTSAGTEVYNSGWVVLSSPTATGEQITHAPLPGIVYDNNMSYTITVQVKDSFNLVGFASVSIDTAWIPPAAPIMEKADPKYFNTEGKGYIEVTWYNSNREAGFVAWAIYRRLDEINPLTGATVEEGTWEQLALEYRTLNKYTYLDYYAPAGKRVLYQARQIVDRFGDQIESVQNQTKFTIPVSDGYWLIEPGDTGIADAFQLSSVTDDSYDDEYDEEEFTIVGRGRYVDRGDRLGVKGSLTAKLRDTETQTARQKKRRLEAMKHENADLYLRTPFGDVYRVSISNLSISRVAGVGVREFVDVTIPYSEVGQ